MYNYIASSRLFQLDVYGSTLASWLDPRAYTGYASYPVRTVASYVQDYFANAPLQNQEIISYPPRGIINRGCNCWANSLIHMLSGSQDLLQKIYSSPDRRIQRIANILKAFQAGLDVDSQAFRLAIRSLATRDVDRISDFIGDQIDVIQAYQVLAHAVGNNLVLERTWNKNTSLEESETEIVLDLRVSSNFNKMVDHFFNDPVEGQKGKKIVKKFQSAPTELVFQAKRFAFDDYGRQIKLSQNISNVPLRHSLQGATYAFTSCIIHIGENLDSGHYVTLEKRGNTFYYINDETVFRRENNHWVLVEGYASLCPEIPPAEMMAQGYLFHYTKVGNTSSIIQRLGKSLLHLYTKVGKVTSAPVIDIEAQYATQVQPSNPLEGRVTKGFFSRFLDFLASLFRAIFCLKTNS